MVNYRYDLHSPEPRPEDLALQDSFSRLQEIATKHATRSGINLDEAPMPVISELANRVNTYLDFEFSHSEGIRRDMPLVAAGEGGYILIDEDDRPVFGKPIRSSDAVVGIVHDVTSYAFPTIERIRKALQQKEEGLPFDECLFAAALVLKQPVHDTRDPFGAEVSYQFDTSLMMVVPAVAYGMKTLVAQIAE